MEGEKTKQSPEDMAGSETILYDTLMVAACQYTFVQTHRMYNTQSDPNVNGGLWVTMTCQGRFMHCNKCPTLIVGAAVPVSGHWGGGIWELSELSAQF